MSHREQGRERGDREESGSGSGIRGGTRERSEGAEIVGMVRKRKEKRRYYRITMSFSFAPYKKHALVPGTPFKPCRSLELLSWHYTSYSHSTSSLLSRSWAPVRDALLVPTPCRTLWTPVRTPVFLFLATLLRS